MCGRGITRICLVMKSQPHLPALTESIFFLWRNSNVSKKNQTLEGGGKMDKGEKWLVVVTGFSGTIFHV